jgi:hypothetical protein
MEKFHKKCFFLDAEEKNFQIYWFWFGKSFCSHPHVPSTLFLIFICIQMQIDARVKVLLVKKKKKEII